ncbi:hypothetical protein Pmi06nite_60890 [Planotetraspora mira]|uniref:Uncharacterized protein n=1 Tax=Planotetraspora mira TaxID=58121 RepID=A0A8J3X8Z2_9ACTN|nr:hypothetical protein Pmi06nite_60890 [Planotetraspora mira]
MFSGGKVSFNEMTFSGGEVDFSDPRDWSRPPVGLPDQAPGLHLPTFRDGTPKTAPLSYLG